MNAATARLADIAKRRMRPISFDRFARGLLESYGDAPYTTRYAVSRTLEILEEMGVKTTAEIERDDIEERFAAECRRRGWLKSTRDTWEGRLRAVVRRGSKLGLLRREPRLSVSVDFRKCPRTTVGPPREKMERLIAHAAARIETWEGERIYALMVTIADCGMALVAAINLRPDDVDLGRNTLKIWVGRGKRFKDVRISSDLARVIAAWLPRAKGFVFPRTPEGGKWHMSGRIAGKGPHPALESLCGAAGVGHITFQMIRGYHSQNCVNAASVAVVPAADVVKRCVVQLTSPGGPVRVYGRLKRKLTSDRFNLIKALIDAGPGGLSKPQLDAMAKATGSSIRAGWRQVLMEMRKSDGEWARAIIMAGGAYGRYRIAWVPW